MNKGEFIKQVQAITGLPDKEKAEAGTRIILSLLSHRLTPQESKDVAAQLSQDLKDIWDSDTWISNFLSISRQYQLKYRHKSELYSLIDNETAKHQVPIGAEQLATAVFHVLKDQIDAGEILDIAQQLPTDIELVWLAA